MKITVDKIFLDISNYADTCTHCNHSMEPRLVSTNLVGHPEKKGTVLEIVFKCTRHDCSRLFISTYRRTTSQGDKMIRDFKFISSMPFAITKQEISYEIENISPSFCEVYQQAHLAEIYNLNEIAGVGYRKALEFLIKDYCISNNEDATDNIKSLQLAKVIGQYVEDANIKVCAKRAAWLGNDETHYVKTWADKDINDLKVLIKLTIGWVQNCILTKKYLAEMA